MILSIRVVCGQFIIYITAQCYLLAIYYINSLQIDTNIVVYFKGMGGWKSPTLYNLFTNKYYIFWAEYPSFGIGVRVFSPIIFFWVASNRLMFPSHLLRKLFVVVLEF